MTCSQNSQMVEDDGGFFEPKNQIYCTTKSGLKSKVFWKQQYISKVSRLKTYILLTSSNNQISEFRIPNTYNEILFILFFAWSKVGPTVSSAIYNPL